MKHIVMLVMAFGLFATGAIAADAGLPEYIGTFAGRAAGSGPYMALERSVPTQKTKVRGFGFGGAAVFYGFPGDSSQVRFKSGDKLEFVVRVAAQDQDPQSFIQLFALKQANGERVLSLASATMFGSHDTQHEQDRPFEAAKLGTNFFKVTPPEPLAPGEYGLSTTGSQPCFLFGVDP
jgi:hypothetical protein